MICEPSAPNSANLSSPAVASKARFSKSVNSLLTGSCSSKGSPLYLVYLDELLVNLLCPRSDLDILRCENLSVSEFVACLLK